MAPIVELHSSPLSLVPGASDQTRLTIFEWAESQVGAELPLGTTLGSTKRWVIVDYRVEDNSVVTLILEGPGKEMREVRVREQLRRQAKCQNDHVLSADNTSVTRDGYVRCLECDRESKKARKRLASTNGG